MMEIIKLNSTILVVDDDETVLRNLADMFSLVFQRVLTAADGKEALALMDFFAIDVICTDIVMPHDGIDLITKVRNDLKLDIPIIISTAHPEYKNIFDTIPNTFVVIKPASVEDFLDVFAFIKKDVERNASYARLDEAAAEAKRILNMLKDMK